MARRQGYGRTMVALTLETLKAGIRAERRVAESPCEVEILQVVPLQRPRIFEVRFRPDLVKRVTRHPGQLGEEHNEGKVEELSGLWTGTLLFSDQAEGLAVLDIGPRNAPEPGQRFLAYPFPFLMNLANWAASLLDLPATFLKALDPKPSTGPTIPRLPSLRPSQKKALEAAGQRFQVIWGPPGTGKTFTLGALIAGHLAIGHAVLGVSTSNVAVDLLTLAIDDACRALGHPLSPGELIRAGRPNHPALLNGPNRKHLLQWTETLELFAKQQKRLDEELRKLRLNPSQPPDRIAARTREADLVSALRKLQEERAAVLARLASDARCVTTTFASYVNNSLLHERPYHVTVIDEASMVPAAAICRLMGDPRQHFCIGGDFLQLPPVAQASGSSPEAEAWLGKSVMDHMHLLDPDIRQRLRKRKILHMLTEQSRMHPVICQVVSKTFYNGELVTIDYSKSKLKIPDWPAAPILLVDPNSVQLPEEVQDMTTRAPRKGPSGWLWDRSAQLIRRMIEDLLKHTPKLDRIVACTPYRMQARLLSKIINPLHPTKITAGTIHRLQGSEADIVFFDLVAPESWFVCNSETAPRLINVAFSRSKKRLVVVGTKQAMAKNSYLVNLLEEGEWWVPQWGR